MSIVNIDFVSIKKINHPFGWLQYINKTCKAAPSYDYPQGVERGLSPIGDWGGNGKPVTPSVNCRISLITINRYSASPSANTSSQLAASLPFT